MTITHHPVDNGVNVEALLGAVDGGVPRNREKSLLRLQSSATSWPDRSASGRKSIGDSQSPASQSVDS